MITFANKETAPLVRRMWKICFQDDDESMDVYFSRKYKDENTLIYFEKGEAVASLQMLRYSINFYGRLIPFSYLAGLCTLPEYRRRGYMEKLIHEAHRIICARNISLAILIPAEERLERFYEKYGYEEVFEGDDQAIPLKDILEQYKDIHQAYLAFNNLYSNIDFCVQKTEDDFKAIVEDFELDDTVSKTNLSGMARIIDPYFLLKLYAEKNLQKEFRIRLKSDFEIQSVVYSIKKGEVVVSDQKDFDLEVDICLLCRLLFGFKLGELDDIYLSYFSENHPIMNLMLE